MSKPIAVLISDVHYSLPTLELADAAMRQAIAKANELEVPLIVAGDLHDTKANLRGECVNRMIDTFSELLEPCYILRGNHDQINEKSEEHSITFLSLLACVVIVDEPLLTPLVAPNMTMIPYHHDPDELRDVLGRVSKGSTLIMHQGITGSNSGDYIQDKSAITPADVAGFRVISGHYHSRQTIELPDGGSWSYIGNPYSLNYGEANDPEKGYQILMSDGSLEFAPTNLRKHVIVTIESGLWEGISEIKEGDLVWCKVKGTKEYLQSITRSFVRDIILEQDIDFRLTLEPTDLDLKAPTKTLTQGELFDNLIDSIDTSLETKTRLKTTWKSLCVS